MSLTIDHVPFAFSELEPIREEFDRLGIRTTYGGVHDNDATHMAIAGFSDRTYVELIAERADPAPHDYWPERIRADAGPAGWAVRVDSVLADCHRTLDAGETVHGPFTEGRDREDGRRVEWDRATYGPSDRAVFPFVIADRTPLARRVPVTVDGSLDGLEQVVLAVPEPQATIERLRDRYRLATPPSATVPGFGEVWSFPGAPVAVVGPGESWIDDRLDRFPPGPCSCLLATSDLDAARETHPLAEPVAWPDGRVARFESDRLGWTLAVVERDGE